MAIDAQAEKVLQYLQAQEQAVGDALLQGKARPWIDYRDIAEAGFFDNAALHSIFSRNKSNDNYAVLREQKDAQSKELITAKLSADCLAGLEQSYRAETRSRVRTFIHAAGRRAANGTQEGPLYKSTVGWWSRILSDEEAKK